MIELLSIGDLVPPGTYRVHSRFRRAVNFTDGSRLVTVLGRGADAGPVNIVVRGFGPARVDMLRVERGAVLLDDVRLPFDDRWVYLSTMRLRSADPGAFLGNLAYVGTLLERLAPDGSLAFLLDRHRAGAPRRGFEQNLARHIGHCVNDVFYWNRLRGIERLKGCGIGLTPSGDDFICGFLIGLNVLGHLGVSDWADTRRSVLQSALRGNLLTDTLLYLAEEGRVFESMKLLAEAIDAGSTPGIRAATERLVSTGATSGADTGVGFYMTVREGLAGRLRGSVGTGRVAAQTREEGVVWS